MEVKITVTYLRACTHTRARTLTLLSYLPKGELKYRKLNWQKSVPECQLCRAGLCPSRPRREHGTAQAGAGAEQPGTQANLNYAHPALEMVPH